MGMPLDRNEVQSATMLSKEPRVPHKHQTAVSIVFLAGIAILLLFYVYFKERENKPFKNLQDDSRV